MATWACHLSRVKLMTRFLLFHAIESTRLKQYGINLQLTGVQITGRRINWLAHTTPSTTLGWGLLCIAVTPTIPSRKVGIRLRRSVLQEQNRTSSFKKTFWKCLFRSRNHSLRTRTTLIIVSKITRQSTSRNLSSMYTTVPLLTQAKQDTTKSGLKKAKSDLRTT